MKLRKSEKEHGPCKTPGCWQQAVYVQAQLCGACYTGMRSLMMRRSTPTLLAEYIRSRQRLVHRAEVLTHGTAPISMPHHRPAVHQAHRKLRRVS